MQFNRSSGEIDDGGLPATSSAESQLISLLQCMVKELKITNLHLSEIRGEVLTEEDLDDDN